MRSSLLLIGGSLLSLAGFFAQVAAPAESIPVYVEGPFVATLIVLVVRVIWPDIAKLLPFLTAPETPEVKALKAQIASQESKNDALLAEIKSHSDQKLATLERDNHELSERVRKLEMKGK